MRILRPITLALLVAGVAIARFRSLSSSMLDGDEVFSILTSRSDWSFLAAEAIKDAIHPPLFYILLHLWLAIGGEELWWVRLLPALLSAAAVAPFLLLAREVRAGLAATLAGGALWAFNPLVTHYSQHVRMYSLLMLLSVLSLWIWMAVLRGKTGRAWSLGLLAVNVLLVYSHYYGWLVAGLELAILAAFRKDWRRRVLWHASGLVLAFAPWALLALNSLRAKGGMGTNLGWIERPQLAEFLWFFVDLCGVGTLPDAGTTIVAALLAAMALVLVRAGWKRRLCSWDGAGRYGALAVFAFVPPLAAFGASQVLPQSIWGHRHLLVSAAPFFLLCALLAVAPPWRLLRGGLLIVLAIWAVHSAAELFQRPTRKIAWDALTLEMLEREGAGVARVPLFALGPHLHYPVWFVLEELKSEKTGLLATRIPPETDRPALFAAARRFDVKPVPELGLAAGGRFWVLYSSALWKEPEPPRALFERRGCRTGAEIEAADWYQAVRAFPVECR